MKKILLVGFTMVFAILAFQTSSALAFKKKHADYVTEGGSTQKHNLADWCKKNESVKIWVEGASTSSFAGIKCPKIKVHVEGASTLCLYGTASGELTGYVEGASTVKFAASVARRTHVKAVGASTVKKNKADSFTCSPF